MKRIWRIICAAALMSCLFGCALSRRSPEPTEVPNSSVTYVKGADFTGVVRSVDEAAGRIQLYNVLMDEDEEYQYTGATEIFSKNDRDMSMSEVEPGEVYDVYCAHTGDKLTKMKQSQSIQEKEHVRVSFDEEKKQLTADGVTYAYSDHLVVLSEGKELLPMEIASGDEVTFRGVKGRAYSLVVTRGHGYIRPTGYKDFLGGTLTLEGEAILPVSKDMLLTVPEGTQGLSMVNGDLMGRVNVEVRRGQVTKVNMKKYQSQMPNTARVAFEIEPDGAELYINGILTDYHTRVPMKYGNHYIRAVLEGYSEYSGVATIRDPGPTIRINLATEDTGVDTDDEDSETTVSASSDSGSGSDSESDDTDTEGVSAKKTDEDHKITVSTPVGAAVYLDGTYKGEVPCSFTKVIGSITLTLTKEGYTTKSYSVEISDDSQDVSWSFPDLPESDSKG